MNDQAFFFFFLKKGSFSAVIGFGYILVTGPLNNGILNEATEAVVVPISFK